jgi:hypothetical protein
MDWFAANTLKKLPSRKANARAAQLGAALPT